MPNIISHTAADLIAHLENGGVIATGHPDRPSFLRYEIWESNEKLHNCLEVFGFGSSIGTREHRLLDVLYNPNEWVKVEALNTSAEIEAAAKLEIRTREELELEKKDRRARWL